MLQFKKNSAVNIAVAMPSFAYINKVNPTCVLPRAINLFIAQELFFAFNPDNPLGGSASLPECWRSVCGHFCHLRGAHRLGYGLLATGKTVSQPASRQKSGSPPTRLLKCVTPLLCCTMAFRHREQRFRKLPKIGHVHPECPVTINRNDRSRSPGILGHDRPECHL